MLHKKIKQDPVSASPEMNEWMENLEGIAFPLVFQNIELFKIKCNETKHKAVGTPRTLGFCALWSWFNSKQTETTEQSY